MHRTRPLARFLLPAALACVPGALAACGPSGDASGGGSALAGLSGAEVVSFCGLALADAPTVERPCMDPDRCLAFASGLVAPRDGGNCSPTLDQFEACVRRAAAGTCHTADDLLAVPGCGDLVLCGRGIGPDDPVAGNDRAVNQHLCRTWAAMPGAGPGGPGACPDPADCVLALESAGDRCAREDPPPAACGVTVAGFEACTASAAAGGCDGDLDPACRALMEGAAPPPGDAARLVDLDAAGVRRACLEAFPEQGNGAVQPGCDEDPLPWPFYVPQETCVATVGGLRCRCTADPGAAGCGRTAGDLRACVAARGAGGCPWEAATLCAADAPAASGLDPAAPLAGLAARDLAALCGWRTCLSGGPGYVPYGCDHNLAAASVPPAAACEGEVPQVFARCPDVTVGDLEGCLLSLQRNDACHRPGSLLPCALEGDRETCHLLAGTACGAVTECLRTAWSGVFADGPGQAADGCTRRLETFGDFLGLARDGRELRFLLPAEGAGPVAPVEDEGCFQDTARHAWHLDFLRSVPGLEDLTPLQYERWVLSPDHRVWWAGALLWWPAAVDPGTGRAGLFTFSLYFGPEPSLAGLVQSAAALADAAPVTAGRLWWLPLEPPERDLARLYADVLADAGIRVAADAWAR